LKKGGSYKVSLKSARFESKLEAKSPQPFTNFTKANHNFNLNTQRVLSNKLKTSNRYQYVLSNHNKRHTDRNDEPNSDRKVSKTGRSSLMKEYQSKGRNEHSSSDLRHYKSKERLNSNYFTSGAFSNTISLNTQKQSVKINLVK